MDQSSSQMISATNRNDEDENASDSHNQVINFYNNAQKDNTNLLDHVANAAVVVKPAPLNNPALQKRREQQAKSRNRIMNDAVQLSLITVNSSIMSNSADLLFDRFEEDSQGEKDEEEEYLTFQLCEGEEMNNEMANFIGIHMLNDDINGEEPGDNKDQEGGLTYQCPKTGSHFEYIDLLEKIRKLKQKRNYIDEAIRQEDER